MKTALHLFLVSALSCMVFAAGCEGDDEDGNTSSNTTTTTTSTTDTGTTTGEGGSGGTGGGTGAPMVPELGAQIERMGRPAINTALNKAFEADTAVKDVEKDAWNAAPMSQWNTYIPEVARNLGILDSLDANCGNQLLADGAAGADRYLTLATVLADDRLWVNLEGATCDTYLGVEAGADDCGGRRLTDDVIERSYSVLAAGILVGIDDTIDADPGKTGGTDFPYLAEPLP